jgi:hypothetical protein
MIDPIDAIEDRRERMNLSVTDLWWRYFAIGGMLTEIALEAILYHALVPTVDDCDLLAVAINERCQELGDDHPIPYSTDQAQ